MGRGEEGRREEGEGGGQEDLLAVIGDVTQKLFLIPLGPHVFLTVNSVHTRLLPCTLPGSFSQFQSPNGRAYIPRALRLSHLLLQCSSSPC